MIGQDCDIRTLSKVNLTQQNRHIDVTFDNICQLILAEIQWKAKNCMKKNFFFAYCISCQFPSHMLDRAAIVVVSSVTLEPNFMLYYMYLSLCTN